MDSNKLKYLSKYVESDLIFIYPHDESDFNAVIKKNRCLLKFIEWYNGMNTGYRLYLMPHEERSNSHISYILVMCDESTNFVCGKDINIEGLMGFDSYMSPVDFIEWESKKDFVDIDDQMWEDAFCNFMHEEFGVRASECDPYEWIGEDYIDVIKEENWNSLARKFKDMKAGRIPRANESVASQYRTKRIAKEMCKSLLK